MVTYLRILSIILLGFALQACDKDNHVLQGYVEGELTYLASPDSGKLMNLAIERGQTVHQGDLIFQLDPQPELAQLSQAVAEFQQAQAELANDEKGARPSVLEQSLAQLKQASAAFIYNQKHYQRMLQLFHYKAINQDQLNLAKSDYDQAKQSQKQFLALVAEQKLGARDDVIVAQQKAVAAAEDAVKAAEWKLDQKTLKAPGNGIIEDTFYTEGEEVNVGSPIASLLTPDHIDIIFFIPEAMLSSIHLQQSVMISVDGGNQTYAATISYISAEAEYTPPLIYSESNNKNLVFRIRAKPKISEAMQLHPGQPVYIRLS